MATYKISHEFIKTPISVEADSCGEALEQVIKKYGLSQGYRVYGPPNPAKDPVTVVEFKSY